MTMVAGMNTYTIRPYDPADSIPDITAMLHRAYAGLLAAGMRFLASHQDDELTLQRLTDGYSLVAESDGEIVGTISAYPSKQKEFCEYYRKEGVYYFGQFGVDPEWQGSGLGRELFNEIERYVRSQGASEIALDTSERATHLIEIYRRWGFEVAGEVQWPDTNYKSLVMSKKL